MSEEPQTLAVRTGQLLTERDLTISTAESCTGGLIAHLLTNISGSSGYVTGGLVAYSNAIKANVLNVRESTLVAHGAVSGHVAAEMAQNCRAFFNTDYALSITGIAGPGGGTAEKPVGLTYIGLSGPDGLLVIQRHIWHGDRESNKRASADAALQMLIDMIHETHP